MKKIVVPNDLAAAKRPTEIILRAVERCGYCENVGFAIKLALEEALTNAFRHGNKCDPSKHITVCYEVTSDQIDIEICDEGEGFQPEVVPDPTLPENINRPHGRGIMLMRSYLDEVKFCESGNSVRLILFKK